MCVAGETHPAALGSSGCEQQVGPAGREPRGCPTPVSIQRQRAQRSLAQLPDTVVGKALPLDSSPQPAIVPWRQLQLPMARGLEQSPGTPQSGTALGAGMLLSVGAKSQPRDQGYLRGVRC